jgi:hypothetical protein
LGDFNNETVHIETKPETIPYHGKSYQVPHVHEAVLKKEVDRLVQIGVLRKSKGSPWASPTFIIPKKNNTVRLLSELQQVNKIIFRNPWPLPKINYLMKKLQKFQ